MRWSLFSMSDRVVVTIAVSRHIRVGIQQKSLFASWITVVTDCSLISLAGGVGAHCAVVGS
jgi:hypothetical protein